MVLRPPSKRDAILILVGALCTHLLTVLAPLAPQAIVISHSLKGQVILEHPVLYDQAPEDPQAAGVLGEDVRLSEEDTSSGGPGAVFPETTLVEHVPGWTVFRDVYMFNGTLLIVSSSPSSYPEIRYMTSTGLAADVSAANIAAREPTQWNMDFLSPEQAAQRWGESPGDRRITTVEGNTLLFNDPPQFLAHYYHFCAELLLGTWSFWTGAAYPEPPPPVHRAIFPHSSASGWRDHPGFNSYFLRAAFPSLTVEVDIDWQDRVAATAESDIDRAWHLPYLLLADRSAAFRGRLCGSTNQRTASESVDGLIARSKLDVNGLWWRPIRNAVWRFAGATGNVLDVKGGENVDEEYEETDKFTITYVSRQGTRRRLIPEDHDLLVSELEALVARKNAEASLTKGKAWVLNVVMAETLTKNEQVRLASETNVLLGVHGNGLSHLILLPRTRFSAVIEIFYPSGFAYDYEWTARAVGIKHYGVWNDTYFTEENTPRVHYPEGFQGPSIPVYGPTIANLIEKRIMRELP
ncbi:hypothetical protein F5J12DRAFT_799413 [Pisolithus orientalis]|uniref:uncharacterized protein n=1 Tax=Pisolithus orientalis TaxID=936130 RepID=UPI002224CB08|nr:uncharacterized protein F5J12DRAFT_799413 [Pisolithus orientalis]KAI6033198.1 hypothetical protein F5J12DRAFT_799413 [Pisolithus orientalis]